MHREDSPVSFSPFDQCPKGRPNRAEIDRDALTWRDLDRSSSERRNTTLLQHRRRLGGTIKVDFDNLLPSLRFRIAIDPAHEACRSRGERKDILPTLAMASATKMRPSFAV